MKTKRLFLVLFLTTAFNNAQKLSLYYKESDNFIPWAWGVNGFFTVIGSVGAVILGMMLGFNIVIVLAILCYACAMFLIPQN